MLPIGDENPHPPGFKPKLTYALIAINVIIFLFEVAVTGQFFEFSNRQAMNLFLNWGAVPGCITGEISGINTGVDIINCPAIPELTLLSSIFMHGGLLHLGGNMLFLWIFGDNIEAKFGRVKYLGIYLLWGIGDSNVSSGIAGQLMMSIPVLIPLISPVMQPGTAPQFKNRFIA